MKRRGFGRQNRASPMATALLDSVLSIQIYEPLGAILMKTLTFHSLAPVGLKPYQNAKDTFSPTPKIPIVYHSLNNV